MTHIREQVAVRWPGSQVPTYLEWYIDRIATTENGQTTLELKIASDAIGGPRGVTISRDVVVTLAPVGEELNRQIQQMSLRWSPKGGGPFPNFNGFLTLRAEGAGRCAMILEGDYEPPLGLIGEVFDAALGRRIAHATALELLRRLKSAMEGIAQKP
jgi:hypothetical protein